EDRRLVAGWAADCAESVRRLFENAEPGDDRVRVAIAQARAFANGDLDVDAAIRTRGGGAGAAAREARTPTAKAAAYAAEQAAAVAHMGAHALGAAGYAGKARAIATDENAVSVVSVEARRMVEGMNERTARALRSLPMLGDDNAGPLGVGRLSSGDVGATIRGIQSLLHCEESTE